MAPTSIKWMAALVVGLVAAQGNAPEAEALATQKEKDSYAIGADLASNLKRQGVQVETEALIRGMHDVFSGSRLMMSDDEVRDTLRAYQVELKRKQIQTRRGTGVIAEENQAKGAAFLAENQTKEGVVTLPSGLQYKILKTGNGRKPTETATVECHHRGCFIDGQEFNSSDRAGKPAIIKMTEVIPGWKEALRLMPVGSKWRLFVPPQLAYGERGVSGSKIGPNATLIFELELLAIK